MTIVAMNKVVKSFTGDIILEKVSLQLEEGERVGLIGRNGEGKSTILKILKGTEGVDSGIVTSKKGAKIGLLEQLSTVDPNIIVEQYLRTSFGELEDLEKELRALEGEMATNASEKLMNRYGDKMALFGELGGYEMDANLNKVVNGLDIGKLLSQSWGDLSGGEKTKTALAHLLLQKTDLLLLDEPTNHLDLMAVEWLTVFLQHYSGTVLVVSHDRYFLDEVVEKMVELENRELIVYHTNFSGYLKEREERLLREFQDYKDQQKKIKKMQQAIKRLRQWAMQANPPNDAMFRRAKNMERALERMEKVKRPVLTQKQMQLQFDEAGRSGQEVVVMENLSKSFSEKTIIQEVSLQIRQGERVAIIGENGAGKSTLLKIMEGKVVPDDGVIKVGASVKIASLSQQMEELNEEMTVLDAFRDKVVVTEGEARQMLAGFMFYGEMVFRKVRNISGGERMRLRLAQFINMPVNTLILDEPTNHLDIASREVLEEAIRAFSGTIITVSHDRYFIDQLCSKVIWLENKQLTVYEGNYSYATSKRR
ncbi:TPA: ABC-F family ATP-binding cassette domain-containing protein [Listeria monocytogenes]|nr:ABC-F family ATP-binding cassette domain-containing protein [Listeria monocytogenes]